MGSWEQQHVGAKDALRSVTCGTGSEIRRGSRLYCCSCPVNACINLENLWTANTHTAPACHLWSCVLFRSLLSLNFFPLFPRLLLLHPAVRVRGPFDFREIGSCFSFDLLFAFLLLLLLLLFIFSPFSLHFFCVFLFYRAILGYFSFFAVSRTKGNLQQVSSSLFFFFLPLYHPVRVES